MTLISKENDLGAWFFLIGVVISVLIGIGTTLISIPLLVSFSAKAYGILVILGIIVGGFIKITGKESQAFLLAGTILVIVSRFGMDSVAGSLIGIGLNDAVSSTFGALLALFVPATIVVAIKTVFNLAKV